MNERMRFEREIASLQATPGESEVRGAGTASLVLDRVETGHFAANFRPKASGLFRAYFCRRFPSTSMVLTIAGRVLIEKSGVKQPFDKPDLKTFPRLAVTMRVRPTRGVSAAAGGTRRVKADGTFEVSASAALEKSPRRISVRLDLEWSPGKKVSTECCIDYSPLDCFLAVIDRHEATRPAGQTHFEFLSSVRKMFQPAQGSPLASIFPLILDRTRKVPILAALNTPVGNTVKQFETLEINGEVVDIGHVLTGVEAHRRQKPGAWGLPVVPWPADEIESFLTWIGDLGGVLAWVAQETPLAGSGPKPDLKRLLEQKASYEDLRGDLDGINLGAAYDETRSFGENLRNYYEAAPFRRYRGFVANAINSSGQPIFRLAAGSKLDPAARQTIAGHLQMFTHRYLMNPNNQKFSKKMTEPQKNYALDIGRVGSSQSNAIIDYFYDFMNAGLAAEK
jgi:hypothetical protein